MGYGHIQLRGDSRRLLQEGQSYVRHPVSAYDINPQRPSGCRRISLVDLA
jgi:hypothetical protein